MWVLDHLDDLDADFLACYGIDLAVDEVSGPRFFALAHRVAAYGGVMSARQDEQQEQVQDRGGPSATPAPQARADGSRDMELVAFRVAFPGVVSVAKAEE